MYFLNLFVIFNKTLLNIFFNVVNTLVYLYFSVLEAYLVELFYEVHFNSHLNLGWLLGATN